MKNSHLKDIVTFTTSDRLELEAKQRSSRLSEYEAADLRYFWAGFSVDIGMHSVHQAVVNRLLMAPPRDASAPILEELERSGDWVPEGKLERIIAIETVDRGSRATIREVRRTLRQLLQIGLVERRKAEMPDVPTLDVRTANEQQRIGDHTGFEVRKTGVRKPKADPMTREERWKREDEELERSWRTLHGSESRSASADYEPPENVQMNRVNRARKTLAQLNEFDQRVLMAVYGEHRATETAEVEAVRFLVGGDEERARKAIDDACTRYRAAREQLKQERFAAILRGQR